ncbi:MAG TPA: hypothetical protein ACFYD2_11865, partial [Candidatus Avalokitesvara rifleensis]|uniref:hypothetical protein n=1 Tax=Candidatus Avalokitesvara rifleensis TaxID=3367620 RepID=UPI004024D488
MERFVLIIGVIAVVVLKSSFVFGLKITSPKEGEVFEVGKEVKVLIEAEPGETYEKGIIVTMGPPRPLDDRFVEHVRSLPYEFSYTIPPSPVGPIRISVSAFPRKAITIIHSVLPPTTTVTGIGASFNGRKKTFLEIARKPSGELVATEGTNSTDDLSVGADYSDGVARDFFSNADLAYKSLNEKVVIVIPQVGTGALVRATGPGKTDIIVQYGEFTDRVTVQVKECPYIEGVTDKR